MDYTENLNLRKPSVDNFYDITDFNENADIIDANIATKEEMNAAKAAAVDDAVSAVEQSNFIEAIQTTLEGKAEDDFIHIPLVVCHTEMGTSIKEIDLPGYSPEKYPIIAVKFTNGNTSNDYMQLSVNGEVAVSVVVGQFSDKSVTSTRYPMNAQTTLLLSRYTSSAVWRIVDSHTMATDSCYGVTILANNPKNEPVITPNGAERNTSGCAATPNYVLNAAICGYREDFIYATDYMVTANGKIYRSIRNNNQGNPVTERHWWIQYGQDANIGYPQLIHYTMLYDQGDECSEVTGGWDKTTIAGTVTETKNYAEIKASNNTAYYGAAKEFDFSGYVGILTSVYTCGSGASGIFIGNTRGDYNLWSKLSTVVSGKKTNTLNSIDNVSNGFIGVSSSTNSSSFDVLLYAVVALKTDDHTTWQSLAGYSGLTLETLAADREAMTVLMSSERAVEFLIKQCTGTVMAAVLQSETAKTALKASPYLNRVIANPHWVKFMMILAPELLNYTMLYDEGDECESVTWGWTVGKTSGATATKEPNELKIIGQSSQNVKRYANITTTNKIELETFSELYMKYRSNALSDSIPKITDNIFVLASSNLPLDYDTEYRLARGSVARGDIDVKSLLIKLDIRDITEPAYISYRYARWTNGDSGTITSHAYNLWLSKSDPWQTWAAKAGITAPDLDTLLADSAKMQTLMASTKAVDYLMGCTGTLMTAIVNSETAMTALDNSIYALCKAMRHSVWYKFMMMSPTAQTVLDSTAVKVPTMTSNTTPAGIASASNIVNATYDAYKAFDKLANNAGWMTASGNNSGQWIRYDFTQRVIIYKIAITPRTTYTEQNIKNFKLQYYDGMQWIDSFNATLVNGGEVQSFISPCLASSSNWRIYCVDNYGNAQLSVDELQFYGKELMDL